MHACKEDKLLEKMIDMVGVLKLSILCRNIFMVTRKQLKSKCRAPKTAKLGI